MLDEIHKIEVRATGDDRNGPMYGVINTTKGTVIEYQNSKVRSPLPPSRVPLKVGRKLQINGFQAFGGNF